MVMSDKRRIVSIILKCIVILSSVIGTYLSVSAAIGSFMSGSKAFMYFTIQSNILVTIISAVGLVLQLLKKKIGNVWYMMAFIGTVSITLTCTVFVFMLLPVLGEWLFTVYNLLTHIIAPIAFIVDFLITAEFGNLKKKHVPLVLIPPVAYAVYSFIGYLAGWEYVAGLKYPYFFLNWGSPAGAFGFCGELPYMGCMWWIMVLAGVILLLGFAYLAIVNKIKSRMISKIQA